MQEILLKIKYSERGLSKSLKQVNFIFFLTQYLLMDKVNQKQIGSGTSDLSLFRLQNKFRKIPLLVIYYLTKFDDVIYSGF